MRAVLADTGPLYALIDPDDRYHKRAKQQLARLTAENRGVLVLEPIVLETHTLILRRMGPRTAQSWLGEINRAAGLLNPTVSDYDLARMQLAGFPDQKITLFDSTLAAVARQLGIPTWTYDFHFDVLRAEVWREG